MMIAGVVNQLGTDWQKERILPSLLSGKALVCMGYSEPDYGSDVASIVTRAERDGDEWVINGAKMWTTMAQKATWLILLTRTDPEAPKHKGLTMFMFPMDTPGITVEPVPTMGTERTNATFYDNVRVSDQWRLGEVNGGWRTMGVALSFERGVMGGTSQSVQMLREFRRWAEAEGLMADPLVRERLVRVAIDTEVAKLLTQRSAWTAATGGEAGLQGSMTKVFATEAYQKASRWIQEMAGAEGLLQFDEPDAAAEGWAEYHAAPCPGHDDLRGDLRDQPEQHRRAPPGPAQGAPLSGRPTRAAQVSSVASSSSWRRVAAVSASATTNEHAAHPQGAGVLQRLTQPVGGLGKLHDRDVEAVGVVSRRPARSLWPHRAVRGTRAPATARRVGSNRPPRRRCGRSCARCPARPGGWEGGASGAAWDGTSWAPCADRCRRRWFPLPSTVTSSAPVSRP